MDSLSPGQARRIALAAQGFADPRPAAEPDRRHLRRVLGRVGLLQIDSVNVLQRAHYLPLYSRLGPYRTSLLDGAVYQRPRELFEYWGHEASLLPVGLHRQIGEVTAIYVDPPHWGTGAGRALMDAACGRLVERGFTTVRLWVLAANHQARRFYERAGFVPDGATAGYPVGRPDGSVIELPEVRYTRELP